MSSLSVSSVTLVVKAPNQKIVDHKVECTTDWTVRQLKQHLSKVYPTNPPESQQRIIYAGKLLLDESRLRDVLKQYESDQTVYTIHLVCMASMLDSQDLSSTLDQNSAVNGIASEGLRQRHLGDSQSASISSGTTSHGGSVPSVNYGSYVQHPSFVYYGASNGTIPAAPPVMNGFVPYGAEHLLWMQQAYAQSVMQYMQQYHQAASAYPTQMIHNQPTHITPQPANQNFPNETPPPAGAMNEPEPPVQPVRLNAQGRREVDDEAAERANVDWLDSSFTLARFLALMSILFFYSTPQRFLATMILAAIAYLCRSGWLRRSRTENRNQNQREMAEPVPANREAETPQEPESESVMVNLQATHRPSTFEVIWSVISSFFTSLFPENQQPVNIN